MFSTIINSWTTAWIMLAIGFALQVADIATTNVDLNNGARESNGMVQWFMDKLGQVKGLVVIKLVFCVPTAVWLMTSSLPPTAVIACLIAINLVTLGIVVNNLYNRYLQIKAKK